MDDWPADWPDRLAGRDCSMCAAGRPERDAYGVRIAAGTYSDAYLQRADVQRGYTLVIWRGHHVAEPTELTDSEARHYQPLKLNYQVLGNAVPHLHAHLLPRYADDPAPGRPFPLPVLTGSERKVPEDQLEQDAAALRALLEDQQ
jgi:diadenosine tetraphosphate (Ap4A) HIT family hydrolase